jgi:hypothetical protein
MTVVTMMVIVMMRFFGIGQACENYPSGSKLIPSMETRMKKVIEAHGAMIKY